MSLLNSMIRAYTADVEVPEPMGTAYAALLPYQAFKSQSEDFTIAVGSQKLWNIFCPLIGRPDLREDPRFITNVERVQHRELLIHTLQQVFLTKTFDEWEALFEGAGIPFGAINTVDKLVDHPQVKARSAMVDIEHPRAGAYKVVGVPLRLSATPGAIRSASPALGEHTSQTLRELLGLKESEIQVLLDSGAAFGE